MYIKTQYNNILNQWADNELNQQRAKDWNMEIYEGEVETGYDGNIYIKGTAPQPPTLTYSENRRNAYPPINDQLDMIYWDKINNTNLWEEKITEIKNQFPKE